MRTSEVAEMTGLTRQGVHHHVKSGKLKANKVKGVLDIDEASVRALMAETEATPPLKPTTEERLAKLEQDFEGHMEYHELTDTPEAQPPTPAPAAPAPTPAAPQVSGQQLVASMAAYFAEDPTHWAQRALALRAVPDASVPGSVRYEIVEPEDPNARAFSLAGMLRAYLQNHPKEVVRDATDRIWQASRVWWVNTYGEAFPMPSDIQALNDLLNPTTLQAVLEAASQEGAGV